ncbi:hypothetical protein GPECTOR_19g366 [Gonium pectorale]|uniref:Uncharacterized protein n=1 Tax=Gonium pectorale TaxID=33097 RepID=A0A150GJQ5_GONPE|nr:hypothetical protein GPECTOR_19g366 [Gonium pectorale]|eukprot:KXZ49915.1 hypothetical protein GPECTOR_19g366 [Gonium pectorale]
MGCSSKLAQARQDLKRISSDANKRETSSVDLQKQLNDSRKHIQQLQHDFDAAQASQASASSQCNSQQLLRVEAMYRDRLAALKEDCRVKLAAQERAAQERLAAAQAKASQVLEQVKAAAVREVQRAEAFLDAKPTHCNTDQRPPERDANREAQMVVDLQQRLADLRGELVAQVEAASQLQAELVAAQQGRVAAEERMEAMEATCKALRAENVAVRSQLLATISAGGGDAYSRTREEAAQAAALQAAEESAATREALQSVRREQVAASRALMSQLRRMQALESMRLSDLRVREMGTGA